MSIPTGFHTLTPYLIVENAMEAIELYKKALNAEVIDVAAGPDGRVMNAQLKIGNSMLMLNDEFPEFGAVGPNKLGGTAVTMHMYVEEGVDELFSQAVAAGFTVSMPLGDQFWGDRYGSLKDPYGHSWGIGTKVADVSPEQIADAMVAFGGEASGA